MLSMHRERKWVTGELAWKGLAAAGRAKKEPTECERGKFDWRACLQATGKPDSEQRQKVDGLNSHN